MPRFRKSDSLFATRTGVHLFSAHPRKLTERERQSEFLKAAPLVLVPALFALPVWLVLLHPPRFPYAAIVVAALYAVFLIMLIAGTRKLLRCIHFREIDLISALAFGVLLVLFIMLVSAGMFVYSLNIG